MEKSPAAYMDPNSPPFSFDFNDPLFQYTNTGGYSSLPMSQPSPQLSFSNLNLNNSLGEYNFQSQYTAAPNTPHARPYTPTDSVTAIAPQLVEMAQNNLSNSELSGDTYNSGRRSRAGTSSGRSASPASVPLASNFPPRSFHERTTRASVKSERPKRRASQKSIDIDSDDDIDIDYVPPSSEVVDGPRDPRATQKRREEIRRQRIESEQRRRDELREGYKRLKDVLPASNMKSSKVSLLDRAMLHIKYLELTQAQLHNRLQSAEAETQRLRSLHEKMMLAAADHNSHPAVAAAAAVHGGGMPSSY